MGKVLNWEERELVDVGTGQRVDQKKGEEVGTRYPGETMAYSAAEGELRPIGNRLQWWEERGVIGAKKDNR